MSAPLKMGMDFGKGVSGELSLSTRMCMTYFPYFLSLGVPQKGGGGNSDQQDPPPPPEGPPLESYESS